jgi:hypothetical protein
MSSWNSDNFTITSYLPTCKCLPNYVFPTTKTSHNKHMLQAEPTIATDSRHLRTVLFVVYSLLIRANFLHSVFALHCGFKALIKIMIRHNKRLHTSKPMGHVYYAFTFLHWFIHMYHSVLFFHKSYVIAFKLTRNYFWFNDFLLTNDLQKRIPFVR